MTATSQPTQPAPAAPRAPLTEDQAFSVITQRAYIPVWRQKLAELGVPPAATPEEEQLWLETSSALRQRYETLQHQQKSAASHDALSLIRQQLGLPDVATAQTQASDASRIKAAAAYLAQDPDIAHAALSLQPR